MPVRLGTTDQFRLRRSFPALGPLHPSPLFPVPSPVGVTRVQWTEASMRLLEWQRCRSPNACCLEAPAPSTRSSRHIEGRRHDHGDTTLTAFFASGGCPGNSRLAAGAGYDGVRIAAGMTAGEGLMLATNPFRIAASRTPWRRTRKRTWSHRDDATNKGAIPLPMPDRALQNQISCASSRGGVPEGSNQIRRPFGGLSWYQTFSWRILPRASAVISASS